MNLTTVKNQVVELCQEVGEFIKNESKQFDRSKIEQKDVFNNLVSYVDKESEKKLLTKLDRIIPGAGFIAEEGGKRSSKNEYQWIIDPLDGTTNFLHGLPLFSISIGLTENNKPILGIVHEIMREECFYAIKNEPAYCNGQPIRISAVNRLSESLLATGFPYYQTEKKENYLEIIKTFLEKSHGIRRLGSAAIDLAYVACGRLDGFFEYHLKPWDVAGGSFILQQAGGTVTDFSGGKNYLFGGELCAAGNIHPEMIQIIKEKW